MPEIVTPDLTGQANKYLKVNAGETGYEFGTPGGGPGAVNWGDVGGTLSNQTDLQTALDGKADSLGPDENYVTDAQLAVIGNTSGINTGDQTLPVKATGAEVDTGTDDAKFLTPKAIEDSSYIKAAYADAKVSDTAYDGTSWNGVTDISPSKNAVRDQVETMLTSIAGKEPVITNGYGLSGTTTKAVSLTSSSAFVTAETTISAATYADITGASLSLAAGTWLVIGQVNARAVNAIIQVFVAITDGSNNVISEIAISRPASGTASLNSPISCNVVAIVSPVGTTTYKLRGARGLTTHTGSWIAMDGSGFNTTSHASNNSDKGTGIFAIRVS